MGDSGDEWGHQINHFNLQVLSQDTAEHGDNQENTAGNVALSFQFDCIQQDKQRCPTPQRNFFQVHSDHDQQVDKLFNYQRLWPQNLPFLCFLLALSAWR